MVPLREASLATRKLTYCPTATTLYSFRLNPY